MKLIKILFNGLRCLLLIVLVVLFIPVLALITVIEEAMCSLYEKDVVQNKAKNLL